jgi:light-regulated signal transduction histidine kinase (bacteriophytochrome)
VKRIERSTIGLLLSAPAERRRLQESLEQAGHDVVLLEAVGVPADAAPDLVIADEHWSTRECGGLLRWKASCRPLFLPLLALLPARSHHPELLAAGFDDVLREPLENDERLARLAAFLQLRRNSSETLARGAEIEAAHREMEAFAYSVSHDLRAPVRAIEGFTDLLISEHGTRLEGNSGNLLLRVRGAAMRMGRLIDGVLALSRMSREKMALEPVDLTALAREVVAELFEQAPQRVADVTVAEGLRAMGDPRMLRQVLENLLGNAFKYTSCNATAAIAVGLRQDENGASEFFVKDDGAGYDMAYAKKLFRPFERLHGESEFPGVGVGLATVHRIVSRHGGTIRGESAPGRGATFYFTLDAAAARAASIAVDQPSMNAR